MEQRTVLDRYLSSTYNADGTYADATLLRRIKSRFHEGSFSITKDGSVIYFSSESFKENYL
jgi:hypothetical protein